MLLATLLCLPVAMCFDMDSKKPLQRQRSAAIGRSVELIHRSPASWGEALEQVRSDFQSAPRPVIEALIAALDDRTAVPALPGESTMYTVSGNALSLLEDLTDLRLEPTDREWIGFRVHDHRGSAPDPDLVRPPWEAWLRSRDDLPEAAWFHGLSARELHSVQRVLRSPLEQWSESLLADVRALGPRTYPFLLNALLDSEWACAGERQADQANRLLARLHGSEIEPLERYDLLTLDPSDPLRAHGSALVRNRLALRRANERWSVRLLAP